MSQSTNRPPRLTLPDTLPASTMIHNYPYSNRPIKDSEFRILRIQSAPSPHEPLVAKLNICERMPAVPYEALSYVWGKDEGPHENLEILSTEDNPFRSNVSFRIRPNLASALKCSFSIAPRVSSRGRIYMYESLLICSRFQKYARRTGTLDRCDMH